MNIDFLDHSEFSDIILKIEVQIETVILIIHSQSDTITLINSGYGQSAASSKSKSTAHSHRAQGASSSELVENVLTGQVKQPMKQVDIELKDLDDGTQIHLDESYEAQRKLEHLQLKEQRALSKLGLKSSDLEEARRRKKGTLAEFSDPLDKVLMKNQLWADDEEDLESKNKVPEEEECDLRCRLRQLMSFPQFATSDSTADVKIGKKSMIQTVRIFIVKQQTVNSLVFPNTMIFFYY